MLRAVAMCAIVATSFATATAQQPRSVFRAATDLVHFTVTVTDRRGNVVPGLTPQDFEIVEEGQKQTISHFARGTDASDLDLYAGLLFDTSSSMTADLDVSRTAAIKFLNLLPDAKDLTLVDFDTEVRVGRFSQDDFPRLVERIRSRKGDGWTALYDAFDIYLAGAAENQGRTVLVAFTDGGDSRSRIDFADVIKVVRGSNATIYAVGFLEHQSSSSRNEQQLRLSRIAEESGGLAIFPYSMKQIESAYDKILAEIRAQYSLGYVSTHASRDGRWRRVKIRVLRQDLKDLRIRSRAGYFAPLSQDR